MKIKFGGAGEIPPVEVKDEFDEFENHIRKIGVVSACEWFGYEPSSDFTDETIKILCLRSGIEYEKQT